MADKKEVPESLKFVWAYLLEQGRPTNGNWSYYGSGWDHEMKYDYNHKTKKYRLTEIMDEIRRRVKEFGIDWDRTQSPEVHNETLFEGTGHPSSRHEALLGRLYLLQHAESFLIGIDDTETRFSQYVQILANLAADRQRVKDILGE